METRELFERLLVDEPPMLLLSSRVAERGRQARRQRYAAAAAVVTVVAILSTGAAVTFLAPGSGTDVPGGPVPSNARPSVGATPSSVAGRLPLPRFAFGNANVVSSANDQVHRQLVADAGGKSKLTQDWPLWDSPPITDRSVLVGTQVQYRTAGGIGMLRAVTDTAGDAQQRYGGLLAGDVCEAVTGRQTDEGTFVDCATEAWPGGGKVISYSRRETAAGQISNRAPGSTSGPAVYERDVIVVAADGSAMNVQYQVLTGQTNPAPVPLEAGTGMGEDQFRALAESAATAWVINAGAAAASSGVASATADPTTSAAPSGVTSMPAMPSLGGPGITSLRFASPAQITASNAAVYAQLVAAAGGKAKLLKGWPTWDSDPVSANTAFVGTQVQWPVGANSVYLQVVTSSKADAASRYGAAVLKSGPCAVAANHGQGAPADCQEVPVPGRATAWTWDLTGAVPDASGAKGPSSYHGVLGRSVLVIAKDGSTLALTEFGQQGHAVGGGVPDGVLPAQPDQAALFTLATQLAQAWEGAAG